VPVCGTILPNRDWDASILSGSTISIGILKNHPKPGESVSGIELTSRGIPGIRRLTIVPYFDETVFFPAINDTTNFMTFEQKDSIYSIVNYYDRTVGPYAPQAIFNPQTILDTLTSYSMQSRTLGWIKGQTTTDKYLGYFASAKTSLQQNKIRLTRTTLQQVLADVNIDSTSNLTSEAYALIRYNTEYLLSQLPTPPPVYTLIVKTVGKGSVIMDPNKTKYDSASTAQLTATPEQYYSFRGWGGDASGSANPLLLTMNSNKTVTATFLEISISSMIDSLIVFKHRAQANGWIGDDNFIKELDNGLENAKKHLARGDSVNCGKELAKFQDKVQKEYDKKAKSKDKRFVTEEGYTLLYNNAQYIIDRLPGTK
jgi:hypothetical protein